MDRFKNIPKPHLPQKLPFDYTSIYTDPQIIKLVTKANIAIGTYEGFLESIINPMLLISPLLSQEAVLSSKLEGTHATLEDLLNYEAGNKVDIERDELHEIINYRKALFYALKTSLSSMTTILKACLYLIELLKKCTKFFWIMLEVVVKIISVA